MDFSARRQFRISDKVKLQSRIDFFNLFNHPNFGPIDTNLGSSPPPQLNPGFGIARGMLNGSMGDPLYSVGGPRSIQLSLRLRF